MAAAGVPLQPEPSPGPGWVQALRAVPDVNASWMGDFVRVYHNIDVSVAVQTPSGLMVPIVRDADALGLGEIAGAVKELAAKVRVWCTGHSMHW